MDKGRCLFSYILAPWQISTFLFFNYRFCEVVLLLNFRIYLLLWLQFLSTRIIKSAAPRRVKNFLHQILKYLRLPSPHPHLYRLHHCHLRLPGRNPAYLKILYQTSPEYTYNFHKKLLNLFCEFFVIIFGQFFQHFIQTQDFRPIPNFFLT